MKISEWLKELLVAGIIGNLSGLFDGINDKVEQITDVVGMTPQQWNGGVFSMVKNLSETVVTPIAGIILTAVACIELLSMMIERNNMRDFDLFEVFIAGMCGHIGKKSGRYVRIMGGSSRPDRLRRRLTAFHLHLDGKCQLKKRQQRTDRRCTRAGGCNRQATRCPRLIRNST